MNATEARFPAAGQLGLTGAQAARVHGFIGTRKGLD
jgi:hypothetical protein